MSMATASQNGAGTHSLLDLSGQAGVYERLMDLIPEMEQELEQLDGQRDELTAAYQGRLADLNQKRKRLIGMLRQLGVEMAPAPKQHKKAVGGRSISQARLNLVIDAILKQSGPFTTLGIREELGEQVTEAQMYAAFTLFREVEFIRLVGTDSGPNGRSRKIYQVLDAATGERLKTDAEPPARSSSGRPASVSDEALIEAIKNVRKATGEPATIRQLRRAGLERNSDKQIRTAAQRLCRGKIVREVGRRKDPDATIAATTYELVS